MSVNKDPIIKRCRYLGISPAVLGVYKKTSEKKEKRHEANARRKVSEYGLQLKEKQKLKFIYGVLEKPFHHYFEIASKMEGQAGNNLVTILESRLDNVVFRMGMATTRREARQLATHGHFLVNGNKVDIPSYRVKVGDVITLREKSRSSVKFKDISEKVASRTTPVWLEVNKEQFNAKVVRMPSIEDIDYEVAPHLIVELYSK